MIFWVLSAWTLLFYTFLRLGFLWWNHVRIGTLSLSELISVLAAGLRFDLWAVIALGLPAYLIFLVVSLWPAVKGRRIFLGSYLVLQSPFLVLNLVDIEFVNFTGRRFHSGLLFNLGELRGGITGGLLTTYWPSTVLGILGLGLFAFGAWVLCRRTKDLRFHYRWQTALGGFLFISLAALSLRGGLQTKPLSLAHAQVSVNPELNQLVLNSTFTLLRTLGKPALKPVSFMTESEALGWQNGKLPGSLMLGALGEKNLNVVVLIVESLSYEYLGPPFHEQGYIPFITQIAQQGLHFPWAFANGRRSIEGIAAILGSIPAVMDEPFLASPYLSNEFHSLADYLGPQGYSTHFFHGGNNGTMFFDRFAKRAGFQNYFGAKEYPNPLDHDGTWGIFDEPFLQWTADQLNEQKKPFLASIFLLSSHNPFRIPNQHKGRFAKGTQDIHESLGYVDYAVEEFFKKAKQQDWYAKTLFVITADHTYKPDRPEYRNELSAYRVPLIFFREGEAWKGIKDKVQNRVVSQVDIVPSVLDYLGITPDRVNYLGRSVFRTEPGFAVFGQGELFYLAEYPYFLKLFQGQPVGLFSLLKDWNEENPLQGRDDKKRELDLKFKATQQYFSQGLWQNKLYYSSKLDK
jgi:phosphoglycerol transferase MdoB-like AlkP superfamily enzyme